MIYKTKYLDDRLLNPSGYVNQPISFHSYLTYIENKDNKKQTFRISQHAGRFTDSCLSLVATMV